MNWIPIDTRPLPTGYYLVGHSGHQEKLSFFSPMDKWMPGTKLGWRRQTDRGWVHDDPVARFGATHCMRIEPPPRVVRDLGRFRDSRLEADGWTRSSSLDWRA